MPTDTEKTCIKCGRTGTRQFIADGDAWVCVAKGSCRGRVDEANAAPPAEATCHKCGRKGVRGFVFDTKARAPKCSSWAACMDRERERNTSQADSTTPASMGGPLSEADRPPLSDEELALMERLWAPHQTYVRDLLDEVYRLRAENDVLKAAPQILASPDKAKRIASLVASSTRLVQIERDDARARVGVLEGQLATARELHKPERRYTPDDGETSYATYAEAADASFTGFGTPVSVTFFEVCSHCASIEMAEGCDHQYKESLWPCDDAVALGLDGGDPDA